MGITKHLKLAVTALTLTLGASQVQAADPEYTFKLHHFLPPPSMAHSKFLQPWAEKIEAESDGRIKIEVYPSMQLGGKPPALYDQVRKGIVDITWTVGGYTPGRFPKATVFELPFMATDAKPTSMALQEFADQEMAEEFKDVHLLAVHTHAPGSLHSRDTPIKSADDLKGMKLRAPNKTMATGFSAMGANSVFMPVTQMPSALSKGVLDVAVLPYEVVKPMKIHQLVKHHTEIKGDRGLYANFFVFAMNKKAYNKLPADLQKVIDNNSGIELAGHIGALFDEYEQVGRDAAVEAGNSFYELDAATYDQWKKDLQFVTDDWMKDMKADDYEAERLYDLANSLLDKYQQK